MKKYLLLFLLHTSLLLSHNEATIYSDNNEYQVNCAKRALEIFSIRGDEEVLDIGCGDGKVTQYLAESLTTGTITGIDISDNMIEHAKKNYPSIEFKVQDVKDLEYKEEYDLAVAFSTLEWIDDQPAVIQKIYNSVRPGGRVLLELPTKLFNPKLFKAIKNVIHSEKWKDFFIAYQPNWILHDIRDYHEMFRKSGFHLETFWPRMDEYYFESKEAMRDFLRPWFPYLSRLETEEQKQAFLKDVVDEYCRLLHLNERTVVPYTSQRITIIGKKS